MSLFVTASAAALRRSSRSTDGWVYDSCASIDDVPTCAVVVEVGATSWVLSTYVAVLTVDIDTSVDDGCWDVVTLSVNTDPDAVIPEVTETLVVVSADDIMDKVECRAVLDNSALPAVVVTGVGIADRGLWVTDGKSVDTADCFTPDKTLTELDTQDINDTQTMHTLYSSFMTVAEIHF